MEVNVTVQDILSWALLVLMAIAVVVGLVFWFKSINKKYAGLKFGEKVIAVMVVEAISLFVVFTFAVNLFEGLSGASVQPDGHRIFAPARLGGHMVISITAITTYLMFFVTLKAMIFHSEEVKKKKKMFAMAVFAIFCGITAILSPIINIYLIATGLGETQKFNLFLAWLNPFASYDMATYRLGLPKGYSVFENMENLLQINIVMTFFHFVLMTIEGMFTFLFGKKSLANGILEAFGLIEPKKDPKTGKDLHDDINNKGHVESIKDMVKEALKFYSLKKNKYDSTVKSTMAQVDRMEASELVKLTAKMKDKVMDPLKRHAKEKDVNKAAELKLEIKRNISDIWAASPARGEGFGRPLKQKDLEPES